MRRRTPDECPRCGAPLPGAPAGVGIRTCGYCHTTVEARENEAASGDVPTRTAASQPALVWSLRVGAITVVVGTALALGTTTAPSRPSSAPAPAPAPFAATTPASTNDTPKPPTCDPLRVRPGLLVVDQDDKRDFFLLVVESREPSPGRRLSARDPSNGDELWSRPLPRAANDERTLSIPLDDTLVVALPNQLWGLAPHDGRTLWQRALEHAPEHGCEHGEAFGLIGENGGFTAYSAATGTPVSLGRAQCTAVYDSRSDAPNFAFVAATTAARWLPRADRFEVTRGLLPRRGSAQVVLGADKSGGAASVGVLTNGRWLWQANVANEAPELARFTTPPLAAVRGERVVVPYLAGDGVVMTALELTTGERRWTTALPNSGVVATPPPSAAATHDAGSQLAISRGGYVAYRAVSGALWVSNLETGAIEWRLGCDE